MSDQLHVDVRGLCTCHDGAYVADVDTEGEDRLATWAEPATRAYPVVGAIVDADGESVEFCHRLFSAFESELYSLSDGRAGASPEVSAMLKCGNCGYYVPEETEKCECGHSPK